MLRSEIDPLEFGRDDAVADENRFGIEFLDRLLPLVRAYEIVLVSA